ncbi:hypothetical protein ACHAO5_002573 [Verticillium nonalfalfae]
MPTEQIRIQGDAAALCDRIRLFQEMCTNQMDGFRPEDLACVALSACASRQRRPQSAEGFDYMDMETDQEKNDRRRIIHKLYNRLLVEYNQEQKVSDKQVFNATSALSWALLQVTNIDEMRKLEQTLDSAENVPEYFQNIKVILEGLDFQFKIFLTQPLSDNQKRLGEGEPPALRRPRSNKVKETDTLARLWGADREKAISEKLFPNGTTEGIDVIGNVICLSPDMHAAWSRYDFALFPMRPKEEKAEAMGSNICASAREILLTTAIGIVKQRPRAFDLRTGAPILDGQIFTIKAAMKDHLPDYDILMLQWDIARVASLCGAAESGDDYDKDAYDADAYDADAYDADAYDVDAYDTDDDKEHVEAEMEMTNE